MNKGYNNCSTKFVKMDMISIIEKYVNNIRYESKSNANDVLREILLFLKDLKNEKVIYCDKFKPKQNPISKSTNSLLSIADIKMELFDEKNNSKKPQAISLNGDLRSYKGNNKPILILKEISINTDPIMKTDQSVQTILSEKVSKQDTINQRQNLVLESNELQKLMQTCKRKVEQKNEIKNSVYLELSNVLKYYTTYFNQNKIKFTESCCQTEQCWVRDGSIINQECLELSENEEPLHLTMKKHEEIKEKVFVQFEEIQSQCEMIDELSIKNCDWLRKLDAAKGELSEMKEINEFLESENLGLTSSTNKLLDDFQAFQKIQDLKHSVFVSQWMTEKCLAALEKRESLSKLASQQHTFDIERQEKVYAKERRARVDEAVVDYLEFDGDHGAIVADLESRIRVSRERVARQRRQRDRWLAERDVAVKANQDFVQGLDAQFQALRHRCEVASRARKTVTEDNERLRSCFADLRTVHLQSTNRGSISEAELCRAILSRNDVPQL